MTADSRQSRRSDSVDRDTLGDIVARVQQISAENEELVRRLADGEFRFRKLAKAVWRVQEEERRSIALDLHDGLGQVLTALINHLQHPGNGDAPADEQAVVLATSALREVRRISRALRPSVLDDLGLDAALRWLVRTTGEAGDIDIELRCPEGGITLDTESETLIFRVVQEALTNTVKHAGASRARVAVERADGRLRISITDNGCGFDAAAELAATDRGFGARGMRDRAELFGGRLTIASASNEGTSVVLELPENEQ